MTRVYIDVHSGLPVNAEIFEAAPNDLEFAGVIFSVPDELWEEYKTAFTKFITAETAIIQHVGLKVPHKSW